MESFLTPFDLKHADATGLLDYYRLAIDFRKQHKDESEEIARLVFDATHPSKLSFEVPHYLLDIRDEFGALEAPGMPSDESDPDVYRDSLWNRLELIVNKKRTV